MEIQDMTNIFKKYSDKWVALTDENKVIAAASTLEEVLKIALKKGYENPITANIPDFRTEYVL